MLFLLRQPPVINIVHASPLWHPIPSASYHITIYAKGNRPKLSMLNV
jgi:hypothetical protein